ncbi:MAG TPA: BMP family ABC transporter substrate-binding protein [Candidatus Limnocylindrales bacterium]|nr:BMP family ABC transporter substrate-binding protein [Candidatus Limnocylindrales bacterium]
MHDSRRPRWGVALAAGALALTLAAPAAAQEATVSMIGYAAPEPATDFGWNQQGLIGTEEAASGIGAEVIDASGAGYGDIAPTLNSLKEDGAQFIVAQASGYGETAVAFARENDIPVLVWEQSDQLTPGLVGDAETRAQEGGYLAGVLAASMTQTGQVGVVISASGDPNWQKQAGGFVTGARSVNPDIVIHRAAISADGYGDEPGGKLVTEQVIAAGADVVFGMGDGSSFGMLAAVETSTPPGADQAWFIDVIGDKTSIDEQGVLLSSVLWDFSGAYTQALADLAAGTYGETVYYLDAANGGISILDTPYITDEARAAIEAARAGIADGSIVVPETPTEADVDALVGS